MKIPTPQQVGLPPYFSEWRHNQEPIIDVLITSKKRAVAVCAPTGSGKMVDSVAAALLSGEPTCIVTGSRGLQDEYNHYFNSIGMVDIRGKRNYQCDMREDYTCEEGAASRCPYKGTVSCPASQAEMRAATSKLVVTNYDKWIAAKKFGQGMSHFTQVIFDECHEAPSALARAMQVTLHHREIEDKLHLDFLSGSAAEEFPNWKVWASFARETAKAEMQRAFTRIQGLSDPKPSWVKHFTHMRNLVRRLAIIATGRPTEWVVEEVENVGFQFDPIRPGRYAEAMLLFRVPRIICISATIRPKTLYMMGIKKADFDFHEFESDFDPKRAPIYYVPTMRVDYRNRHNMHMLWARLDQIAARRRDRKGLVQTVSFSRQQEIISACRFSDNMLFNERGEPPADVINIYREAGPGTILVSPSFGTGYDFKDDQCRWNFLCKIPFDPPSKIVKAREHDDPEYRGYKAMQGIVQNVGRPVRSKTDWAENFICDDNIEWFLPKYRHLAPKSFHSFFRKVDVLPQPPKLESM